MDGAADLDGKVVVVTGGTSGIGRAAALALAAARARVVVAGRREAEGQAVLGAIISAGGEGRFVRADVAIETDVRALVDEAVSAYGRLDGAFNNAGIAPGGLTTEITEADYRRVFDTNVWGVASAMKHEIAAMLATGGGSIVNNSSVFGHVGVAGFGLYNASKHAVEGLTKTAALEHAKRGIRVNSVAPAFVGTPMVDWFVGESGAQRDALAALHPVGRLGSVEEVAGAVLFLLSGTSSFITGTSLRVDGGWGAQ